jgi:hypothetical protein
MTSRTWPSLRATGGRVLAVLVLALGLRAAYLYALYNGGDPSIAHHHIESAVFVFVVVGAALAVVSVRRDDPPQVPPEPSRWWLAVFVVVAAALYRRALGVGLLSDDFELVARAASWNIGPVSLGLFRPVPLFAWSVLLSLGSGAAVLHAMNIVLHALAAYLTTRVVHPWTRDARWSVAAGLVFVTSPIATEAVTWCAGVFDVSATVLVLATVLAARRAERGPTLRAVVGVWILAIAAMFAKEGAVVVPGLLLVDAYARRALGARALRLAGLLLFVAAGYSAVRIAMASAVINAEVSRYVIQRAIFSTSGSFGVPLHEQVIASRPLLALLSAIFVLALLLTFFFRPAASRLRGAAAAMLWSAAAIVPVLPFVFSAPDLQFSRYFYLPLVGWAGLVATIGGSPRGGLAVNTLRAVAVAGVVVIGTFGVGAHVAFWQRAAGSRDRVLTAARSDDRIGACRAVSLQGLPDSVAGAYVFRNGIAEALQRETGVAFDPAAAADCTFKWDELTGTFVPPGPQG